MTEPVEPTVESAERQAEAIRGQAERDADATRREATVAAERLLGRVNALEVPLGELVVSIRDEMERMQKALQSGTPADSHKARQEALEPYPKRVAPSLGRPPPEADGGQGGLFSRLKPKRSKGTFILTEGHCAVCQRTFTAGSGERLATSGWKVNGDVGLCPDCQADGWQLPDGARLPFRRGES